MKLFDTLFKRKNKSEKPHVVSDKKETAEVVQQLSTGNDNSDENINSNETQKNIKTEKKYLVAESDESSLPQELIGKLPDPDKIKISSFSNSLVSVGKRYRIGMNDCDKAEDFIQYYAKIPENVKWSSEEDQHRKIVFAESFHPFVRRYSKDIVKCAEYIIRGISYKPYSYEITENALNVKLDGGYYDVEYQETPHFICYRECYQESYHDGGGSGSEEWYVYASPNVACKTELSEEIEIKKCPALPDFVHMPSCRGYWEENGHVYLVDPWGLSGNFEYYCHVEEQRDYESENKIWEIGVPYDR